MGGVPSNMWATWTDRANQPDRLNNPTFDPLLGFPEGRKMRGRLAFFFINYSNNVSLLQYAYIYVGIGVFKVYILHSTWGEGLC